MQVGRPVFYGLAARGEAGARHVIEMLNRELELAMALCGCRSVAEVTRRHVLTEGDRIRALLRSCDIECNKNHAPSSHLICSADPGCYVPVPERYNNDNSEKQRAHDQRAGETFSATNDVQFSKCAKNSAIQLS